MHQRHSILSLLPLCNLLQQKGINPEPLLQKHGVQLDTLSASTLVETVTELAIVEEALAWLDEPLPGLTLGKQVTITSYGLYAMLLLSAPSFKTMIDCVQRYQRLSLAFSEISVHYLHNAVEIRSTLPELPAMLREFVADRDFAGNAVFINEVSGGNPAMIKACGIARPHPGEGNVRRFRELLGVTPVFAQDYNWLHIPIHVLPQASKHSNALAHKLFTVQAQETMRQLYSDSGDLVSQIGLRLDACLGQYPGVAEMAAWFHMSESTLRRRLQGHNTSYRQLLDKHREKRALDILSVESPSLNRLAEQLGYADSISFLKAFKRWTGTTPRQYLQHSRNGKPDTVRGD